MEPAVINVITSLVVALCVAATFLYSQRGKRDEQAVRMSKMEAAATAALQEAAEAKIELRHSFETASRDSKDLHERITLHIAQFSMYREKVATEMVNRELLREFETRMVEMQTRSEARLTQAIEGLSSRFDKLIDSALRKTPGRQQREG